ncbi:MAG: phosphotransferase [Smithellaceae bacterium]
MPLTSQAIRNFLTDHLGIAECRVKPIEKGGSDRHFFRVMLMDGRSFIFMRYGTDVEENAYWAEINRFLTELDLPVPKIIAYDYRQRFLLIEDLGDEDLHAQSRAPWSKRRRYYLTALSEIYRLHHHPLTDLPVSLKLCPGYDRALYQWEHNYFLEHCVGAVCGLELAEFRRLKWAHESDALIDRLQQVPPCLIHRDFQSQNILLRNDRPVFIDFQGMRQGNPFYDLASLICDPYVTFTDEERHELITFYYRVSAPDYALSRFTAHFWEAATQRLMQALGAYGFLGLQKNKPDFLQHIDGGLRNLAMAAANAGNLPVVSELAQNCLEIREAKKHMA